MLFRSQFLRRFRSHLTSSLCEVNSELGRTLMRLKNRLPVCMAYFSELSCPQKEKRGNYEAFGLLFGHSLVSAKTNEKMFLREI